MAMKVQNRNKTQQSVTKSIWLGAKSKKLKSTLFEFAPVCGYLRFIAADCARWCGLFFAPKNPKSQLAPLNHPKRMDLWSTPLGKLATDCFQQGKLVCSIAAILSSTALDGHQLRPQLLITKNLPTRDDKPLKQTPLPTHVGEKCVL